MKKALFGFGGQAQEIASLFNINFTFIVDDEYSNEYSLPLSKASPNEYEILVALGESEYRKKTIQKLANFSFFSLIHNTAIISKDSTIGCGSYIGPYCIITNNVKIGSHSIINRFNSIGHNTRVGNFLSMMSSAVISGNCDIGDCFYMGNNSSIREKITICDNVKIGMNAAVVKNINEKGIYAGIPAKKINKQNT
jgi:sugar O-acyltransferase (sialic acid O-acetyltransferase NeuD family)